MGESVDHLVDRDKLVALIPAMLNQILRCNHGLSAIGAQGAISAVMQEDHVAATNLPHDFFHDYRSGRSVPVVASHVPHHRLQSELVRDTQSGRPSASERWTKQVRMLADGVG